MEAALTYLEVSDVARTIERCAEVVRRDIRSGVLVPDARTMRGGALFSDRTVTDYMARRAERIRVYR